MDTFNWNSRTVRNCVYINIVLIFIVIAYIAVTSYLDIHELKTGKFEAISIVDGTSGYRYELSSEDKSMVREMLENNSYSRTIGIFPSGGWSYKLEGVVDDNERQMIVKYNSIEYRGRLYRLSEPLDFYDLFDNKAADDLAQVESTNVSENSTEAFLMKWDLKVDGSPIEFNATVPEDWTVELGQYPEGLYWGLANVFSKEAGLDLTRLKGKDVEVQVYALTDGLPGQGESSDYIYKSNLTLLVQEGITVGAWLNFNKSSIGPAVNSKYLEDITGFDFPGWIEQEDYFRMNEKNEDLKYMDPAEVLEVFFAAINTGDTERAISCIGPDRQRDALMMNKKDTELYNPGFGDMNSLVFGIEEAELLSYKYLDYETLEEIEGYEEVGDRKTVELAANVYIVFVFDAFNDPDYTTVRFVIFRKYGNGWKIEGFGTGP